MLVLETLVYYSIYKIHHYNIVQLYLFVMVIVKLSFLIFKKSRRNVAIYFTKNKMYAIFLTEACIIDDYIIKYYSFLNPNKGPA